MAKGNKKIWLLFFLCICLLSTSVLPPSQTWAEKVPSVYIVKEGDTLWGISNRFFNDPFDVP